MKRAYFSIVLLLVTIMIQAQTTTYTVTKATFNTDFGKIDLVVDSRNNRLSGIYHSANGTFSGTYNPNAKMYRGTFVNKKLKKKGYFRFTERGKKLVGKWGWTPKLTGNWNGTYVSKRRYVKRVNAANTGVHKMKITLNSIKCNTSWDRDKTDDYLLKFVPTLKLSNKSIGMSNKRYSRIEKQIKKYGPQTALHVHRKKGVSDHQQVQLHVKEKRTMNINNSGILEIPKATRITDSSADFALQVIVDEVSNDVGRVIHENDKLNLKNMLNYLTGKASSSSFSKANDWVIESGRSLQKSNMGTGYEPLYLTSVNGKRIIKGQIMGTTKNSKGFGLWTAHSSAFVNYTIELVD
ncbi:hypothetical protein ABN763_18120 [Spongiivirga sp. MCCC 1A20706]|uniref:hypothetical protein n=1 Tax=Spongiivirga sp. MCCC 1A20706 TaxID=3160963 RepID=UPI003977AE53